MPSASDGDPPRPEWHVRPPNDDTLPIAPSGNETRQPGWHIGASVFLIFVLVGVWYPFALSNRHQEGSRAENLLHGIFLGFHPFSKHTEDLIAPILTFTIFGVMIIVFIAVAIWAVKEPQLLFGEIGALAIWLIVFVTSSFASFYYVLGADGRWSHVLSKPGAIYVAVGTLTTAGFSGIEPRADLIRLVLASQMIADLIMVTIIGTLVFQRYNESRADNRRTHHVQQGAQS